CNSGRFDHGMERSRIDAPKIGLADESGDDVFISRLRRFGKLREHVETHDALFRARLIEGEQLEPGHETRTLEHAAFDDVAGQLSSHAKEIVAYEKLAQSLDVRSPANQIVRIPQRLILGHQTPPHQNSPTAENIHPVSSFSGLLEKGGRAAARLPGLRRRASGDWQEFEFIRGAWSE